MIFNGMAAAEVPNRQNTRLSASTLGRSEALPFGKSLTANNKPPKDSGVDVRATRNTQRDGKPKTNNTAAPIKETPFYHPLSSKEEKPKHDSDVAPDSRQTPTLCESVLECAERPNHKKTT